MDFDFTTETITPDSTNVLTIGGTGGIELSIGTTAQRPVSAVNGTLRYNTDLGMIEGFSNNSWTSTVNPGTITSVSVAGNNGISISGSPVTSSGTITLGLGAITPTSVAATGTVTGSNLSGTNTGDQTITLTGDVTGSGTGTFSATLATVNANVGQFAVATFNAKGLATAATNLSGDATSSGTALTLATVNGSPQTDTFRKITVNGKGLITATSAVGSGDITTALGYTPVNKAGDTMTGNLNMGGTFIVTGLATPTSGTDATNKNYVDSAVAGLSWKQSVRVATTAAGTLATSFANGQTVDSVVLATGDRILIKNQAAQTENGIYIVQSAGAPVRSTDADTGAELQGASVFVDQGTTNDNTGWVQITNAPITIGVSNIVWNQFSGSSSYNAGTGLTLIGNTFSLTSPVLATLGGTGQTSYAVGDLLFANSTTTLGKLADVATGNALISGGVGTAPSWGKIGLTTHVTDTLAVGNGGTGLATTPANGQIDIGNGTGFTRTTITAGSGISVTNGSGSITISGAADTVNQVKSVVILTSTTTTQMSSTVIPTISSGAQIASITITPSSASSTFLLFCSITVDFSTNNHNVGMAVFRGTTLIGVLGVNVATAGRPQQLSIQVYDTPATASAVTYTIRVGTDAPGTTSINIGNGGTVNYGGATESAFTIIEST
jgi:hypothetical protein